MMESGTPLMRRRNGQIDLITGEILDAAYRIHCGMGPGLLESVYEQVLARCLERRGLRVSLHPAIVFSFDGMTFSDGLRPDLVVDGTVIVELKSCESMSPVHAKQLLTYLRLMDLRIGLLLNFGMETMKAGTRRVVNRYDPLRDSAAPREISP
jgi:GxxExxY protein